MNSIQIEFIEYKGENYYYCNEKFKSGINLILGENQHGKTTFTYILLYALGFNISAFSKKEGKKIDEIVYDKNNSVKLGLRLDGILYTLKRKINENIITIIQGRHIEILPLNRNNTLCDKKKRIFSDWILEKLNINLMRIENILSVEHYLNFDDLFRFNYYDQETDKRQMISNFGVGKSIFKNSAQMKRFIFETILSHPKPEYYSLQKEIKILENNLKEKKAEILLKEKVYNHISENLSLVTGEHKKKEIKDKIDNLIYQKNKLIEQPNNSDEKKLYIDNLKQDLDNRQSKIISYQETLNELKTELRNIKKLDKIEKEEINTLKMLSESSNVYKCNKQNCPICGKDLNINTNKCVCGNDCEIDLFHFMYTNKDYIDILKSRVSSNKTTNQIIEDLKIEIKLVKEKINISENRISSIASEIENLNNDLITPDVENSIISLNKEISTLQELLLTLSVIDKESDSINLLKIESEGLENEIEVKKERLSKLEIEKDEELQNTIAKFEGQLNLYLKKYYNKLNESNKYKIQLDRNYIPITGSHIPHSRLTEIKIFFYLTLLKLSIEDKDIIYPRLLIIDTIKDHGIDIVRLKAILEIILEFENEDCQIIMTSGYEEINLLQSECKNLIIERIDKSKLLSKV